MNDETRELNQEAPGGPKPIEGSVQDLAAAELPEADLAKVAGGYAKQKPDGTAGGNVAAKWNVAQGSAA